MPDTLKILIENFYKQHKCDCYEISTGYLNKEDLLQGAWNFKESVVFVTGFSACGVIPSTAGLSKPLLTVDTPNNYIQYEKIANITDSGTIQTAHSDFVYRIDNGAKFTLSEGADAMFAKIYSCSLQYVVLQPINCRCHNEN